ncbi:MAG TPA: glycosyltransferase family 1 protein [Flavilitoribacter sp.]|nr:glycosyltransferase family 1 protein [Flavilitoribacter sp.]
MSRKKIAVNARFLLPGKLEGIGGYSWEVARRLAEKHPEIDFIFLFDRPFDRRFIPSDNVRGVVIPPPARHAWLWWAWFEVSLPIVFRRLKPDAFFSPDGYCSLRAGTPTVMVTHDLAHIHYPGQIPEWARRYYDKWTPRFCRRADRIIAVSDFVKEDIIHQYGIAPDKISVAGNGCRPEFIPLSEAEKQAARQRFADGRPYFFYLGALHPRKNLPGLIRAFDLFKQRTDSPCKLLIGGRFAWQTGEIKKAVEQAAHREDIRFLGYVDNQDLPSLMGGALALTYVSLFEGFGVPILEAMHCDVPVITSNTASMPEVAGNGAVLVDPLSHAEIANAMERIYLQPELRRDLATAGRQQRERFSWDTTADIIWEVIGKVVSDK